MYSRTCGEDVPVIDDVSKYLAEAVKNLVLWEFELPR